MTSVPASPAIGLGYRSAIADWTRANLDRFDVLEVTVDHCIHGSTRQRAEIFDLVGRIPLTAHGVGLSIGTDVPLDLGYLDGVAAIVERLKAPAYSEHLAFTRVPGRDLANLLPLPKTEAVAEMVIGKVRTIQSRISVPFLLENISYAFERPDSDMSDAEFLNLICHETGAGLLLDIENLYLNATNCRFDLYECLAGLPAGLVQEIHMAGGIAVQEEGLERPFLADFHSHPLPPEHSTCSIGCWRFTRRRRSCSSATWCAGCAATPRSSPPSSDARVTRARRRSPAAPGHRRDLEGPRRPRPALPLPALHPTTDHVPRPPPHPLDPTAAPPTWTTWSSSAATTTASSTTAPGTSASTPTTEDPNTSHHPNPISNPNGSDIDHDARDAPTRRRRSASLRRGE